MAGQSFAMFGWSWTEVSVLGSQVFGKALIYNCVPNLSNNDPYLVFLLCLF